MSNLSENRKARFDYELVEEFEAGLELDGAEVKSVRAGKMSLVGSFVSIRGGEAFLLGSEVAPYQPKNQSADYDPKRARKLLLTKDELMKLATAEGTKGLTIVPLTVYNKGRFIKCRLAIARGKKEFDKRQAIKKRDTERDLKRDL